MLRLVRLQRPLAGLAVNYGALVAARSFNFRKMVPKPEILETERRNKKEIRL
jgi:hypothetical protein